MNLFEKIKLNNYSWKDASHDLIAALTVGVVLIPQGLAYGMLAGLPAEYGLYAALVPMIIYGFFGSSKELNVGPVAIMSIMVLAITSVYAEAGTSLFTDLVLLLALLAGMMQIGFSLLRLGALSNFISRPVMDGFIAAAAFIILVSQIKSVLGIQIASSNSVFQTIDQLIKNLGSIHLLTIAFGFCGIFSILLLQKLHKSIPAAMLISVVSILLTYYFSLDDKGLKIVGYIPKGLPHFYTGFMKFDYILRLLPSAAIIAIICFVGSFSISKTMGSKEEKLDGNKELFALGISKFIGSFFLAMPSTGSFSRSAINQKANVYSRASGIFGGLILMGVLLVFGKLFYFLPQPILAAIVITSIIGLFDVRKARHLFQIDRSDFWIYVATFIMTIVFGIFNGIFIGVALSLLSIVVKAANPNYEILGLLPGSDEYRSINRFPLAETKQGALIVRYDERLFFANADHFYKSMIDEINARPGLEKLIIKASSIHDLDSTAIDILFDLIETCKSKGIRLMVTDLPGSARDTFYKVGLYQALGAENFHINISNAIADLKYDEIESESEKLSTTYAAQSNLKTK